MKEKVHPLCGLGRTRGEVETWTRVLDVGCVIQRSTPSARGCFKNLNATPDPSPSSSFDGVGYATEFINIHAIVVFYMVAYSDRD